VCLELDSLLARIGMTEERPKDRTTLTREELLELHKHYEGAAKDERDFFFRYLNFYTGLLTAIVAVTLTGILSVFRLSLDQPVGLFLLIGLLIGPILTFRLSDEGVPFLTVCYRRFAQAWVTAINIRTMLALDGPVTPGGGVGQPLYKGKHDSGSFIAMFDPKHAPPLRVLSEGAKQGRSSEEVLDDLLEGSDQLMMANRIFRTFKAAGITLGAVIVIAGLLSILVP
jgi:hypothetical protein